MLIDSHCHLAGDEFRGDLPEVVARAQTAGVGQVVCIVSADEPAEIERAGEVRAVWPAVVCSAGIHPHRSGAYGGQAADSVSRVVRAAAGTLRAVAIGEIGLDYHYDFAPREVQRAVFEAQVALAVDENLPVVIHTREASADTFAVLGAYRGRVRGVMHCFTGTVDEAREALDLGFYLSMSGILTFPKAANLREVAAFTPLDRLIVETDAPYLAPVPHRGKRNEPAWVARTASALANVLRLTEPALADVVTANTQRLFGLDGVALR